MDSELQKAVKNIESNKSEVKVEMVEVKSENQDSKSDVPTTVTQMFPENIQRVISQNHQIALQVCFSLYYKNYIISQ